MFMMIPFPMVTVKAVPNAEPIGPNFIANGIDMKKFDKATIKNTTDINLCKFFALCMSTPIACINDNRDDAINIIAT